MPTQYISKFTMPVKVGGVTTNVEFTIKDAEAREMIEDLGRALYWIGVTTTELTDGATTNPITVNSESVLAKLGGMASYEGSEYVWNGSAWQELGKSNFGALAFKSSASGSYTPSGSVAISKGTDTTGSVTGISNVGEIPYFTVSGETATFNAGAAPTVASPVTVITERGTDTATFSGTAATITVS
ncbi:MAG: hypothetical protein J6Y02_06600 [Pseudobutyrivibrio sp.]|nr:hypothetical protein [Pseudobutyrivibrio sp.]